MREQLEQMNAEQREKLIDNLVEKLEDRDTSAFEGRRLMSPMRQGRGSGQEARK